ncbi:hypothetical protein AB0B78_19385 [Streptomyces sp. NPDC040724]|uniref:hypothetical protein n=1 Tax=Streptomyces sp. NPDC040724 TaxID=3155612 RepID=UPI0033FB73CB
MRHAIGARRREFATGRWCAKQALAGSRVPEAPSLPGPGAPTPDAGRLQFAPVLAGEPFVVVVPPVRGPALAELRVVGVESRAGHPVQLVRLVEEGPLVRRAAVGVQQVAALVRVGAVADRLRPGQGDDGVEGVPAGHHHPVPGPPALRFVSVPRSGVQPARNGGYRGSGARVRLPRPLRRGHASKRYPMPGAVIRWRGCDGSASSLRRR